MITPEKTFKISEHRRKQVRLAMAKHRANNREKILARRKELYDYDKNSEYYYNNKEKILANQRLNRYKLTSESYNNLLFIQNNQCAICFADFTWIRDKYIQIDHDHKTGEVRGILCIDCNLGLGRFKDKVENLNSAIRYLNKNAQT